MAEPDLVAVEATEERFRALTHQPSGIGFDETGRGDWPRDQYTFALIREGALRYASDETAKPDPKPSAKAAPAAPAAKE